MTRLMKDDRIKDKEGSDGKNDLIANDDVNIIQSESLGAEKKKIMSASRVVTLSVDTTYHSVNAALMNWICNGFLFMHHNFNNLFTYPLFSTHERNHELEP